MSDSSPPSIPSHVIALRRLAWVAVGGAGALLFFITLVNVAGIGKPGCMPGHEHGAEEAFGLSGISWLLGATPGVPTILLLKKGRPTTGFAVGALALALVTAAAGFLALMMNVFSSLC